MRVRCRELSARVPPVSLQFSASGAVEHFQRGVFHGLGDEGESGEDVGEFRFRQAVEVKFPRKSGQGVRMFVVVSFS